MLTLQVGVTFDSCRAAAPLAQAGETQTGILRCLLRSPRFCHQWSIPWIEDFKKESDGSDDSVAYRCAWKVFRASFATLSPKWKLLWKHLSRLSLVNVSCGPRLCETFPGFLLSSHVVSLRVNRLNILKHPYVAALVSSLKGSRTYWSLYVSLSLNPLWGFPGAANLLPSCLISFMAESSLFPLPVFHQLPTAQLMKTDIAFLHFEKFDE